MASKQLNIAIAVFAIVQAAKSPVINSHTFSLQIHGGAAQCLQSEWKWYICGVNDHVPTTDKSLPSLCWKEWASPAPAPSPSTTTAPAPSSAYGISVSGH
ncbi:hypothetical protein CK203_106022 [Vitis vinifera]|uniref:Uncharacterized protein n=1 Tax=Vitis vinifera TaxID=29760 RepID=A0A438FG82_VITVI|nr:hypothetical protein CK203_106022 [Vitis vinifera]